MRTNIDVPLVSDGNKPFYTSASTVAKNKLFDTRKCKCKGKCSENGCGCKRKQGCNLISLQDSLELLARVNNKISTLSDKVYNNLVYKYDLSNEVEQLDRLLLYRAGIMRYKNKLMRSEAVNKDCVCPRNIQLIFEKAKHILGVGYSPEKSLHYTLTKNIPILEDGLIWDDSNLNSWLSKNPYCAPVDQWEKLAHFVCGKLDIDIEVEEIKCNLTFEIIKESVPLGVLSGLSIGCLAKKNGIYNRRSDKECLLDWEILVEKINTCNLDYTAYLQLIKDCNLTYDVIQEAYACGLKFDTTNGKYKLVGNNFSYDLSSITFNSPITSYKDLLIEGIQLTPGHSIEKANLEKLLADYNLTEKQLRKLK